MTAPEAVEAGEVQLLADLMVEHLTANEARIDAVHVHHGQSKDVQNIVGELLVGQMGYLSEQRLNVDDISVLSRPDFTLPLHPGRGVLVEVERGGTTTNNHDLKDFWKTHLASNAHHLFLVVPNSNWAESGIARERPFGKVVNRLGLFFGETRREVDVISCHIFGYGRND